MRNDAKKARISIKYDDQSIKAKRAHNKLM